MHTSGKPQGGRAIRGIAHTTIRFANSFSIEVKNTGRVRPEDLKSLKAFGEDYPEAARIFLYRGTEQRLIDGIVCLPCELFLKRLHPTRTIATILEELKP